MMANIFLTMRSSKRGVDFPTDFISSHSSKPSEGVVEFYIDLL